MSFHHRELCPACRARRASLEQLIEQYRAADQQRLLQRALRLFEDAEAEHALAEFERPPESIH